MKRITKSLKPETFKVVAADGVNIRDVVILERIDLCGIPGFALHQSWIGFAVSHIPTGGQAGWGMTKRQAVDQARRNLLMAAKESGLSPAEELKRRVLLERKKCPGVRKLLRVRPTNADAKTKRRVAKQK